MSRAIFRAFSALLLASAMTLTQARSSTRELQGREISVFVNGKAVDFVDATPVIDDGRVLVPLRPVLASLPGMALVWDPRELTVSGAYLDRTVRLKLGSKMAKVNGRAVDMDVPAATIGGRTMVPLRFLSEALGAAVTWNDADRRVAVTVPVLHVPGSVASTPPTAGRRYFRNEQSAPIVSARTPPRSQKSLASFHKVPANKENLVKLERLLESDYNAWASNRAGWLQEQANFSFWATLQLRFNSVTFINGAPGYLPGPAGGVAPLDPMGWARWDAVFATYAARDATLQQRLAQTYAVYLDVFRRVSPGGTPIVLPGG